MACVCFVCCVWGREFFLLFCRLLFLSLTFALFLCVGFFLFFSFSFLVFRFCAVARLRWLAMVGCFPICTSSGWSIDRLIHSLAGGNREKQGRCCVFYFYFYFYKP